MEYQKKITSNTATAQDYVNGKGCTPEIEIHAKQLVAQGKGDFIWAKSYKDKATDQVCTLWVLDESSITMRNTLDELLKMIED